MCKRSVVIDKRYSSGLVVSTIYRCYCNPFEPFNGTKPAEMYVERKPDFASSGWIREKIFDRPHKEGQDIFICPECKEEYYEKQKRTGRKIQTDRRPDGLSKELR